MDLDGNVYVADTTNGRVQKLSPEGEPLEAWTAPIDGDEFFDSFGLPNAVAVDVDGNIYVADTFNMRIQKLAPDGSLLAQWGTPGTADDLFAGPRGVALDQDGNVYVADTNNHRVQKLSPDGDPLEQWGSQGSRPGEFEEPESVAVDLQGNVYVSDTGNDRVQMLAPDGEVLAVWNGDEGGAGEFREPEGIAVDADGSVYVADSGNARVMKLAAPAAPIVGAPTPGSAATPGAGESGGDAATAGLDVLAFAQAMSEVTSYRSELSGTIQGTMEVVLPDRAHMITTGLFGPGEFEIIVIGEDAFGRAAGSPWARLPAEQAALFMGSSSFDQFTSALADPNATVTAQGVSSSRGDPCQVFLVENATTSYTVCIDGAYHLRRLEEQGVTLEFYDYNEDITIEAPPGV